MALVSLFSILGLDVVNRLRLPGAKAASVAVLVLASVMGLAACGAHAIDLKPFRVAVVTSQDVYRELCDPLPSTPAAIERCHVAAIAIQLGTAAYNEIERQAQADGGVK